MPKPNYHIPEQYQFICFHCPITDLETQCPDYRNTPRNHANCPLRKVVRGNLSTEQVKRLREIVRLQGYGEKHLARMMVLQAERNALPPNSITARPVSSTLGSVESGVVS